MHRFIFSLPTRVIFGAGAIESTGEEAASCGRHALVVTGTTFARRSGLIDRLQSSLGEAGIAVTIYDHAGPNPSVATIDAGGRLARESGADLVLGLGGGSALDAAKAIAAAAVSDRSIWDYTRNQSDRQPATIEGALPVVQLPIIASTGSETNDMAVVFDEQSCTKAEIRSPHLQARVAIVDPILTFTVPQRYTSVGGMNIVSQMLESYVTSDEFPVTDRIAEGLIRVVMDSLPRAMRRGEDLDARNNLSWVAVIASTLSQAGRGSSTPLRAMAHPISATYGSDHGTVVAALWPSFMRYSLANRFRLPQIGRFKRYALVGRQIFGVHETDDEVAAETTAYRFEHWLRSMEMPVDLRQLSVKEEDLERLAEQAVRVSGDGGRLPGGLTVEDVLNVYEGATRPS